MPESKRRPSLSAERKMRLQKGPYVTPNGLVIEDSDSHLTTLKRNESHAN